MEQWTHGRVACGLLMMLATGILYGATRAVVVALSRPDGADAGRRAIAQATPIAATAWVAAWTGHADIAMAIIIGASVTYLTLVAGLCLFLMPMLDAPPTRRLWPFVLPVALLTLMAGFATHVTAAHALMLLGMGAAIWLVWIETPVEHDGSSEDHLAAPAAAAVLVVAIALLIVGAILAVRAALASSSFARGISPGTLGASILSPLLALPTLGVASSVAQRGYPGRALTSLVGTVLIAFCLILPVTTLIWYVRDWREHSDAGLWNSAHALPYAMATWRVETVLVVVMGLALVPMSTGRWNIGRVGAIVLVAGYMAYVVMMTLGNS